MPSQTAPPTQSKIKKLSAVLIDQIAAGEVVERPASVLKELLENALDAGATSIHVELQGGGIDEIHVSDNGEGMTAADLELCVEQHATSKINALEDLASIRTFGFRGEAVSSIASVSQLEVQSRPEGASRGYRLRVHFGEKQGPPEPCAAAKGTRFHIRDLFSKIPARRKYLRSSSTELSHCTRLVKEVAMGNPDVRFSLSHQGRRLFEFVPTTRIERIAETTRWKWNPLVVLEETEGVRFNAFLWDPRQAGAKNEWYVFVNRRPIRNRSLLGLIKGLYAEADAPAGGVLFLDIREDWLDVNVHPQKWEIRFWRQERLFPWIRSTLRKKLPERPVPLSPPSPVALPSAAVAPPVQGGRWFGQLRSGYWLVEKKDDLLILDGVGLAQTLLFEALSEQFAKSSIEKSPLLPPCVFALPTGTAWGDVIEEHEAVLARCGFEIDLYGGRDACLRTHPSLLTPDEATDAVLGALDALGAGGTPRDCLLRTAQARKRADSWIEAEGRRLLADDHEIPRRSPDGHALVFELNSETIHNYFER